MVRSEVFDCHWVLPVLWAWKHKEQIQLVPQLLWLICLPVGLYGHGQQEWDSEIPDRVLRCAQIPDAYPLPKALTFQRLYSGKVFEAPVQDTNVSLCKTQKRVWRSSFFSSRSLLHSHNSQEEPRWSVEKHWRCWLSFESRPDFCSCSGGRAHLSSLWLIIRWEQGSRSLEGHGSWCRIVRILMSRPRPQKLYSTCTWRETGPS